jgi:predicted P-loop ATPase/GTPase
MEPRGSIYSLFFSGGLLLAKRILIVGVSTFDSGKTTFAGLLAKESTELGLKTEYFKPISAHNYSERLAHTKECIEEKRLYSYDLATISEALNSPIDKFILNPIHRLYVPMKVEDTSESIGTLGLGGRYSILAMERLSRIEDEKIASTMLVAKKLIERGVLVMTEEESAALSSSTMIEVIDSLERVQEVEAQQIEENLTDSLEYIERASEYVLIESFNDAIWPWEGLEYVDTVIAVGQSYALLFDATRFRKAAFLKKRSSLPIREVSFRRAFDLIKPVKKLEWDIYKNSELLLKLLENDN